MLPPPVPLRQPCITLALSYPVLRLFVIEFFPFTLSDCLSAAVLSTSFFYVPGLLEPGGPGGHAAPSSDFGRYIFQTGKRLCPPDFYLPSRIFRPSYGPVYLLKDMLHNIK